MAKLRRCLQGLYLLPLIIYFQVPSSSALPFGAIYETTDEVPNPACASNESSPPSGLISVNSIESTVPQPSEPSKEVDWQPTAYEIGDGQAQAPYTATIDEVATTSSGTTVVSSSSVTSRYSNTPLPRELTSHYLSTSTSTVYVFVTQSTTKASSSTSATTQSTTAISTATTRGTLANPEIKSSEQSFTTSLPDSLLTSLTTSEVQTATAPVPTNTSGVVQTTLETSGAPSANPFPTESLKTSGTLSLVDTSTLSSIGPTATANVTSISAGNIFQPIATDAPPPQILSRADHPVPTLGIQQQQRKLETNKFYANFFLGDQTAATWTHPYSVSWSQGSGQSDSWGLAISHIERDQLATGPKESWDAGDWAFFASPVGIQSLVLSATELDGGTTLTTDTLDAFSVNVNLIAAGGTTPTITCALVQGMGFVTAVYNSGTPLIQSGIGIRNVTYAGAVGTSFKYRVLLSDGFTWLIYVTPLNSGYDENSFTLISSVSIQGTSGFGGYIQIAKVPADTPDAESVYDGSAGTYATAVAISGSVDGTTGTYTFSWTKQGDTSQPLLIFALPHHIESFDYDTSVGLTDVQLVTTTKGVGTAIQADTWTLNEPHLPITMGFSPWSPTLGDVSTLSLTAVEAIVTAGTAELAQNISKQTNTGSIYYDGKALAKFAAIVYVLHDMAHNTTLALTGLMELEDAFALHVNNQQTFPLVYDTVWGGAVSISTYLDSNSGDDFGNTYYNDHHFHYGYFLYAAAVIGYLDPPWLTQGTNKAWVDMLARDFANPVSDDYFPFSRSFDWYMGHSWAKGLFESADGKDEESSSEDTMASFGVKMWGKIINDKNMEARGNLMLAIQARSLQDYFLYSDNNTIEPSEFIGNKVSGVMFENKIDHTTYFGNNIEDIQGINMLPLMPMSTLIRTPDFVQQEWEAYDFATYVNTLQSGWRGILMANLAIIDPVSSYKFFSNATGNFNIGMLDGGASQTWYLAWSAALGGSPYTDKEKRDDGNLR